MKIERIDENTICCTLTKTELQQRNLDVRDMTYGSENVNRLFEEMMKKAEVEVGFEVNMDALMIEATPLSDGAMQIIISSVDDPDELDSRFSKFAKSQDPQDMKEIAKELIESAIGAIEKAASGVLPVSGAKLNDNVSLLDSDNIVKIFEFDDMDKSADACRKLVFKDFESQFYKDEDKSKYYLVISCPNEENKREPLNKVCNTLAEYGKMVPNELNVAYYEEHYKIIIKDKAVEKLALV